VDCVARFERATDKSQSDGGKDDVFALCESLSIAMRIRYGVPSPSVPRFIKNKSAGRSWRS